MTRSRRRRRLAAVHRRMQATTALEAGALGFLARSAVEVSLPLRPVTGPIFRRRAGRLTVTLLASPEVGLPYGRYPRLFLLWLSTRAVRSRRREVRLDGSLSACMRELGLAVTGGCRGTVGLFREQVRRLLATSISLHWQGGDDAAGGVDEEGFRLARRCVLWWESERDAAGGGRVELSRDFFAELTARPVPVDVRAYRALVAPLALDVYAWLSYRLFALRKPVLVGWEQLYRQFGTQTRRRRDFRRALLRVLPDVLAVYPTARVRRAEKGLLLLPSPPSVPTRR